LWTCEVALDIAETFGS